MNEFNDRHGGQNIAGYLRGADSEQHMESADERSVRVHTNFYVPVTSKDQPRCEYAVRHSHISHQNVVRVFPQLAVRQQSDADKSVAEKSD